MATKVKKNVTRTARLNPSSPRPLYSSLENALQTAVNAYLDQPLIEGQPTPTAHPKIQVRHAGYLAGMEERCMVCGELFVIPPENPFTYDAIPAFEQFNWSAGYVCFLCVRKGPEVAAPQIKEQVIKQIFQVFEKTDGNRVAQYERTIRFYKQLRTTLPRWPAWWPKGQQLTHRQALAKKERRTWYLGFKKKLVQARCACGQISFHKDGMFYVDKPELFDLKGISRSWGPRCGASLFRSLPKAA